MMRLVILCTVFIGITGALLIALAPPPEDTNAEAVTRGQNAPLSLHPAMPQPAPIAALMPEASVIRPQLRPADLVPASAALPAPQTSPALTAPRSATSRDEDVMNTLRTMSYGIVKELQNKQAPGPAQQVAAAPAAPKPQPKPAAPALKRYVVQPGDSLPGLAFRFYGTTAAYLSIVNANPALRDDPKAFKAGVSIAIPDTP